jgi:CBS domain-containing protein
VVPVRIEHLMRRDVVTVSPETPLKQVAALLAEHSISGVPVCDAGRRVLGVVSEADILRKELGLAAGRGGALDWLLGDGNGTAGKAAARTAGEAMSSPAITIEPGRPVAEAARLMLERGVNRLPVVLGGELVGIVARADLVRAFRRSDEEIEREILDDVLVHTLWIDPGRLEVSVRDGEVALAGELRTRTEVELVVAYVGRVPGVVDVRSGLRWAVDDLARRSRPAAT